MQHALDEEKEVHLLALDLRQHPLGSKSLPTSGKRRKITHSYFCFPISLIPSLGTVQKNKVFFQLIGSPTHHRREQNFICHLAEVSSELIAHLQTLAPTNVKISWSSILQSSITIPKDVLNLILNIHWNKCIMIVRCSHIMIMRALKIRSLQKYLFSILSPYILQNIINKY